MKTIKIILQDNMGPTILSFDQNSMKIQQVLIKIPLKDYTLNKVVLIKIF